MTMSCQEFVELVTDFLDGALGPEAERRFAEHVANCAGCEPYLDQFRQTIRALATCQETRGAR
jgi:predicted anti-sigma-YlaC factor YlaD